MAYCLNTYRSDIVQAVGVRSRSMDQKMSHQAIMERINNLTDDGVELIDQIIDSLNPRYFIVQPDEIGGFDVKKRIGAGKGIIGKTDHFDDCNDEMAKMFSGENI